MNENKTKKLIRANISTMCDVLPPAPDVVLPGLERGNVGAFISPGGAGKTMWILQAAIQIATGSKDQLGIGDLDRGVVTIINAEDPAAIIHRRIFQMTHNLSATERALLSKNLNIYTLDGAQDIDINNPVDLKMICAIAQQSRLVVLDNLRCFHKKKENDDAEMYTILRHIKSIACKTQAAVIFCHHTNKNASYNGTGSQQQASRGSSVLTYSVVRWQGYLSLLSSATAAKYNIEEEQLQYYVEFGASKCNYGPPISPILLHRNSCGVLSVETSSSIVNINNSGKGKKYDGYRNSSRK